MKILTELSFSHFKQMALLEQEFYGNDHITPAEEAYRWYKRYPYTVVAVEDAGKIAGFINLFPVVDKVFEQLRAGTFNDKDLAVEDIADINQPSNAPLNMFLSCIVIRSEYRKQGLTQLLLQKAVEQYQSATHRFGDIITDNVTNEGMRFSEKYGFTCLGKTQHGSTLFIQKYDSFCQRVKEKSTR